MKSYKFMNIIKVALLVLGVSLFSISAEAWHAHGGYYHHGYNSYGLGWGRSGAYIGSPMVRYSGVGCSYVQRCYFNGCVSERVCY